MATVITNLLSAIPIFGQDIVELNNTTQNCTCFFNNTFTETLSNVLPTVGTITPHALKKGQKIRIEKKRLYLYSLSIYSLFTWFY